MIELTDRENVVYAVAHGKLDDADYDKMLGVLHSKISKYGKVRWYFEMRDFGGWTPDAFWRDLKFDVQNKDNIEKVAVVVENEWQKTMIEFTKLVTELFTNVDLRYFQSDETQVAKRWLSS